MSNKGVKRMDSLILNPVEDFEKTFSASHSENIIKFFNQLTEQSGVDIQLNRETVAKHNELKENLSEIKRKYNCTRPIR
jgi:phosphopantetheinyl transferase